MLSVVVLKQIFNETQFALKPNVSEELKLSALQCIKHIFRAVSADLVTEVYSKQNSVMIGHIVYTIVLIVDQETFRTLRVAAIECLMAVFFVHDRADVTDSVLREHVANHMFVMLPKVVATLHNVMLGDDKQGQAVIMVFA